MFEDIEYIKETKSIKFTSFGDIQAKFGQKM